MLAISKNILAVVKGAAEPLLIVCADTLLPVKISQVLPLPADSESVTVDIYWGATSVVLTQLTLAITSKSNLSLSVHIHRDGGTHVTMMDKTAGRCHFEIAHFFSIVDHLNPGEDDGLIPCRYCVTQLETRQQDHGGGWVRASAHQPLALVQRGPGHSGVGRGGEAARVKTQTQNRTL